MRKEIITPPRTIMEVFKMLPEGTLAEVIENTLYMSPTPSTKHQRLVTLLLTQIHKYVSENSLGEVFPAPLDVFLDEHSNAVQPDILFISNQKISILDNNGAIRGAPDFIIEILSPGSIKHDQVTKKNLYEKSGVKEHWIVDPDNKKATGFLLKNSMYELISEAEGKIASMLLGTSFSF